MSGRAGQFDNRQERARAEGSYYICDDESRANSLAHAIAIERHKDQGREQDREETKARDAERPAHRDVNRLAAGRPEKNEVGARETDTEQDVEHRAAEAGCDRHGGVPHALRR